MRKLQIFSLALVFTIFSLVVLASTVFAVPANPFPQQVRQADGSEIIISGRGDESEYWGETPSGHIVKFNELTRNWCYAYVTRDGRLLPGSEIGVDFIVDAINRALTAT